MKINGYKQNYTEFNSGLIPFVREYTFCVHSIAVWLIHDTILR